MNKEPAFPTGLIGKVQLTSNDSHTAHISEYDSKFTGMTMRDYFAGQVIGAAYKDFTEVCRDSRYEGREYEDWAASLATDAYRVADAMLKKRDAQ